MALTPRRGSVDPGDGHGGLDGGSQGLRAPSQCMGCALVSETQLASSAARATAEWMRSDAGNSLGALVKRKKAVLRLVSSLRGTWRHGTMLRVLLAKSEK